MSIDEKMSELGDLLAVTALPDDIVGNIMMNLEILTEKDVDSLLFILKADAESNEIMLKELREFVDGVEDIVKKEGDQMIADVKEETADIDKDIQALMEEMKKVLVEGNGGADKPADKSVKSAVAGDDKVDNEEK